MFTSAIGFMAFSGVSPLFSSDCHFIGFGAEMDFWKKVTAL
jgi:hypothetical protein